jgi:hypothetical protein
MIRVSRTHFSKLARLSPREWAELLEAQLELITAQVVVWTRPRGRLVTSTAPATAGSERGSDLDPRADRLALAIGRAAENGVFRPLCLVRAVALNRMLERHGVRGSRVRIGVRMRGGRFAAHAWVEYHNRVLGDLDEHVGTFAELTDVHLMDTP